MKKILWAVAFLLAACSDTKFTAVSPCEVVEQTTNGVKLVCSGRVFELFNGADGADGKDGADGRDGTDGKDGADGPPAAGLTIVKIIDPCGDFTGHYDEILLKLSDGTIVVYFKDNGAREFLAVLSAGTYQTTDAQKCIFTVDNAGNVTW